MLKTKSYGVILVVALSAILGTGIVLADLPDQVEIEVAPDTIRLNGVGEWVTVHTNVDFGEVQCDTLELMMEWEEGNEGVHVAPTSCCEDNRGYLVVKFDRADITAIVAVGDVTLTLTDEEGTFEATDTIRVIDRGK